MSFQRMRPEELTQNVFEGIGRGMLITAGDGELCNPMTASWGGLGVIWGAPAATVYVRPQRHTFGFLERCGGFSLCFFGEDRKKVIDFCGVNSGRDVDKVKACGLTVATGVEGIPYFEEAELVLLCRKDYWQDLKPEQFVDPAIPEKWYPGGDYHRLYIGRILEALQRR